MVVFCLSNDLSLIDGFARVCANTPDAVALLENGKTYTYQEMNAAAENLAQHLMANGVLPGDHVVILSDRNAAAVISMAGILRAGAVYVPLDPAFDSKQLVYAIEDSKPKAILWDKPYQTLAEDLATTETRKLDLRQVLAAKAEGKLPFPARHGNDPCYVMYTSGSTGKPKGAVLPNRAILRLAYDQPIAQVSADDVSLANSTISCDASTWEIWAPLLNGGAVALVVQPKPALDVIARVIREANVTVAVFHAGVAHLMIEHHLDALGSMRLFCAGGDVLSTSHMRSLKAEYPDLEVVNGYGPTENSVFTTMHILTAEDVKTGPIPIGIPTGHCECFVIDDNHQILGDDEVGQLVAAGPGVAIGYLNQPEQTAASFIQDPRSGHDGLVYLTGDLASRRKSGVYDFFGRVDRQIKLAGRRIELDEIEHNLRELPMVTDAAVMLATDKLGQKRIASFIKPSHPTNGADLDFIKDVLAELNKKLDSAMLPRINRVVDSFPMTTNRKIDRKALLSTLDTDSETGTRKANADQKSHARTLTKHDITRLIVAQWQKALGDITPSDDLTFFDAGGNSLELVSVHAALVKELGVSFDITLMFEAPRLGQLAAKLATLIANTPKPAEPARHVENTTKSTPDDLPDNAIAIVGMAARIPGTSDLDEFWQHIVSGTNLIKPFSPEDAEDNFTDQQRASSAYVSARPDLADVGMFDAKFFGMLPREAAVADPQARVFIEMAHEVLERSGHAARKDDLSVGVFAGSSMNSYLMHNVLGDRSAVDAFNSNYQTGQFAETTGNLSDCLATRASFKLDLRGPAMTVQTACSTSLTAIGQAILNLRGGQCDLAIAGGLSITFPQKRGYLAQEGGLASDDGTCRPFDDAASGTVFSHGGGVVALRRLEDAIADGDHIHAVIRGVGINNDGADKIAFTAPAVGGQADAIRRALTDADVSASTISYVECHGTATPMGDPIEVSGLRQAFGNEGEDGACALGSIKGNVGHMDAGAGVVGVIKAALMLGHRTLPPVANFKTLNSRIDLTGSPFRIQSDQAPWTSKYPLRAGVSSFGVGGTNVHLVLEEAPKIETAAKTAGLQTLVLSAKSKDALGEMKHALADTLDKPTVPALADIAFTLQDGRAPYDFRLAVSGKTPQDVSAALRQAALPRKAALSGSPAVSFMFPGQGSQYPGMGSGLYNQEPEFARWIDLGSEILEPILGLNLRTILCCETSDDNNFAASLRETKLTQPALYLTQYACARLWMKRGIRPASMIGHSVGEFTAAALAGVFSFETGLKIISQRGQFMQDQPSGSMLSVRTTLEELQPHLDETVEVAAKNAPRLNVVSGSTTAIKALEERLKSADIACTHLHTSHAFHSAMMDPVCEKLQSSLTDMELSPAQIPYVSCVTGTWITDEQCTDPAYWALQARAAVSFADGIQTLAADEPAILLEVGAGNTLSSFCGQTLSRDAGIAVVQSLPDHNRSEPDMNAMANGFGRIWAAGGEVDWDLLGPRGSRRVPLPTYAFQRKLHWVSPTLSPAISAETESPEMASNANNSPQEVKIMTAPTSVNGTTIDRKPRLATEMLALLSDLSGEDLTTDEAESTFLDLGFDSLFLGQFSQKLDAEYGVNVTFRQLLSQYPTASAVADFLDETLPPDAVEPPAEALPTSVIIHPEGAQQASPIAPATGVSHDSSQAHSPLMMAQISAMQTLFSQQLQALSGVEPQQAAAQPSAAITPSVTNEPVVKASAASPDTPSSKPAFSIGRATNAGGGDLSPQQLEFAQNLARDYSKKAPKSKTYVQKYRPMMADPRTAAGFRADWKELVFPVVCERSKGSRIWDIDGNEFIDLVNGFGQTAFGHSPDFVVDAITRQLERGFAIGPQCDLAGPVAERFAKLVGHQRAAFCNTGSEAVMAAMRVARTVTGRDKIVVFDHDYHGQFDEVLVKGKRSGKAPAALPIAPGIPRASLSQMVVLPYAEQSTLDWLRENIGEIAAVIVEPVQSRHPDLRPRAFVETLREITQSGGSAMVMDEVVTGFRVGPRGMQGEWDITPDMATYGKVLGGGMPIGMLAGSERFMDALDGGQWQFGDDSVPEASPTFFAGTFVRHPLVLAAVDATLDHMENHGAELWQATAELTKRTVDRLNDILAARRLPRSVETYSSWFVPQLTEIDPNAALLFPLMRLEGVHIQVGYPCIFTTAHTQNDADKIVAAFEKSIDALREVGILNAESSSTNTTDLPDTNLRNGIPLTAAQREIWMTSQLGNTASSCFNESVSLELTGPVDLPALQRALDRLIQRHDGLRMVFARNGETFDILDPYTLSLDLHDVRTTENPTSALQDLLREDAARAIDITTGPPLRAFVVRTSDDVHVLVLNAHHIVCDGWSFNVLSEDIAKLYAQEVTGEAVELPPAPSFAAFAQEQSGQVVPETSRAFWKSRYEDIPELPELPTDRTRPKIKTFAGATCTAQIPAPILKAARKAGAAQGCTLFATLFAALQITVGRLTGASDIVLGVPTGGQAMLENSALVGHCVNFLPIRVTQTSDMLASDFLKTVGEEVLDAFDHQDYTYGTLVHDLDVARSLNRLPLTEIQFNLESLGESMEMGPLRATMTPNAKAAVNFDLFFNIIERKDGLRVDVDYNSDVFDESTVLRWVAHLERVLTALAQDTERPLEHLPVLSETELSWLAETLNETNTATLDNRTVSERIAETCAERRDATAIEDSAGRMSYSALAARSDSIAAALQATGIPSESRVAVALPRSADCIATLLGVMKAGYAYVPIDLTQPTKRLHMILESADVSAIVYEGTELPECAEGLELKELVITSIAVGGTPKPTDIDGTSTAYVMFTSGTTGIPKGVEISHKSVVNLLDAMANNTGFAANSSLLCVTTIMFDISVLEMFMPLIKGGCCVIAPHDDVLDGFRLVARLNQGDITHMQATPTLWDMTLEAGFAPDNTMTLLAGGEPIPQDLADRLTTGGATLWNVYGPTETTIWSAAAKLSQGDQVTIGGPIANTELHVLGHGDTLVPIGAVGELNIGGVGLAKGYFGQANLTAVAFRDVTLHGQARRLYKTGDLARRLPDGRIEVLGRADTQVKLRGFRIELGEIEAALRNLPSVATAAVAMKRSPRGDDCLTGYVVAKPTVNLQPETLAQELGDLVPAYMVPSSWVFLSRLPSNASGKLDRNALPEPETTASITALQTAPATQTERKIAAVWEKVLGCEDISTSQTLFALGADSLTVFKIAARLMDADFNIEARHLLEYPSIARLAEFIDTHVVEDTESVPTKPSLKSYRRGAQRNV